MRGELGIIGTRYHFADLYGHLAENEAKRATFHFPALDKNDRSTWESKFATEYLHEMRRRMGNINFSAQMQNDVEVMKGEIFQLDDMKTCRESEVPRDLVYFIGVDLAITQNEEADYFSTTTGGLDLSTGVYYIVDAMEARLRFGEQTSAIVEGNQRWAPLRIGLEINAYQEAQLQHLQDTETDDPIPVVGLHTGTDKIARAWKLTALFESGKIVFVERLSYLIEKFIRFPNTEKKDWFDSFDNMVRVSRMRARKKRREVGLI
jgi:predicted phage terminase large subunit-like protein